MTRAVISLGLALALLAVLAAAQPRPQQQQPEARPARPAGEGYYAREERYRGTSRRREYDEDEYYYKPPSRNYYPWLDETGIPYVNITLPGYRGCKPNTYTQVTRTQPFTNFRPYDTVRCTTPTGPTADGGQVTSSYPSPKKTLKVGGACWFDNCNNTGTSTPNYDAYKEVHLNQVWTTEGPDDSNIFTACTVDSTRSGTAPYTCNLNTMALCCEPAEDVVITVPVTIPYAGGYPASEGYGYNQRHRRH